RPTHTMADRFRAMLDAPGYVELPGCHDVLSAIVLERAGFEAVFLSGYGVAASLLGNPHIGLTTLTETVTVASRVVSALGVPVVVDADNGYGNEDNVARSVRDLESIGAAAIVVEDQVLPKRCGHAGYKEVISRDAYLRKLDAALRSRRANLCIIARTDHMDL